MLNYVRRVLENPSLLARVARNPELLNRPWHKRFADSEFNPRGTNVIEQDWDNLIILDACRYDFFEEVNTLPGDLEAIESLGSHSNEYVRANFGGDTEHHDLVIVSGNGFYVINEQRPEFDLAVHDVHIIDEYDRTDVQRKFSKERPERDWIHPEATTEYARRFNEKYPKKRLLIHYHQPHSPYIGPTGMEYFEELPHKHDGTETLETTHDVLRQAYRENLEIVLAEVEELLEDLVGKTVITADHGDFLGERDFPVPIRRYGHPYGVYHEKLVKVPWFVVDYDERKETVPEPPVREPGDVDNERIRKRLERLGYVL